MVPYFYLVCAGAVSLSAPIDPLEKFDETMKKMDWIQVLGEVECSQVNRSWMSKVVLDLTLKMNTTIPRKWKHNKQQKSSNKQSHG